MIVPRPEQFEATVVDIQLESRMQGRSWWRLALDHTEFQAGDGGELEAEAPSGAKLALPLVRVELASDGTLWHVVEKPLTEGTKVLAKRTPYTPSLIHSES